MTSANVIEYNIKDKDNNIIARHRQNIMCKRNTQKLLQIQNPENYTIHPWGYNEEEEMWEGEPERLDKWLKKNKNEI
jgi:hypothetical protein